MSGPAAWSARRPRALNQTHPVGALEEERDEGRSNGLGSFSIGAFANNLFDKAFLRDVLVTPEFGGDFVSPGERRSYGLELGYKF